MEGIKDRGQACNRGHVLCDPGTLEESGAGFVSVGLRDGALGGREKEKDDQTKQTRNLFPLERKDYSRGICFIQHIVGAATDSAPSSRDSDELGRLAPFAWDRQTDRQSACQQMQ